MALCLVPVAAAQNVLTYHNDNARTGQDTNEPVLTPANVNLNQFGKLFSVALDGYVYAQPLILTNVQIPGQATHNMLYAATEHDSLYAVDADNGAVLWQVSFANPSAGVTPASNADVGCNDLGKEIGITGTPVVDPQTGTIYLVATTRENETVVQRLHAIDVADHSEKFGGPVVIQATVPGTGDGSAGGSISFNPLTQNQRPGLLLQNGHVIIGWASYCDNPPYHGWVMSYTAGTLSQEGVFAATPSGSDGGVWMGGAAPAADANFNTFLATGNGTFDGINDFGDSILKLAPPGNGAFSLTDWFTPFNQSDLNANDLDLGSGGVLLLPDLPAGSPHEHLLVLVSKAGSLYLIDRDNMGHYCSACTTLDTQIVQEIPNASNSMFGMPAYWNGSLYVGGALYNTAGDTLKAYFFNAGNGGLVSVSPSSTSPETFLFPGPTPSVSANGNTNGIVWALDNSSYHYSCCQVLYAYDAANLAHELYSSDQAPNGRDSTGGAVKFTVPTIANGKVYVGTQTGVAVFGLLPVAVSPATLSFGSQLVGIASSAQPVTLTNSSNAALTITSIVASAGYAQTNNCGSSVPAGASCTINVTFSPSATSDQPGTLTITDSAPGSPQIVDLTGTGADFMLSASPSSATVAAGHAATYTLSVASLSGFDQAVALACTGEPPLATCALSPDSINPGGPVSTSTVTVSTMAPTWAQPRSTNQRQFWWGTRRVAPPIALLLALTCLFAFSRGRRPLRLGFTLLVLLLLLWTACGGGGTPGTPPGTYSLTVTGTVTSGSAAVKHNVTLRLTVQ